MIQNLPSEPRLIDHGGELSKRWYIDYYVFDTDKQDFVRKRYYGMNKFKTLASRRKESIRALSEIRNLLASGFTAGTKPTPEIELDKTAILNGFKYALEKKKSSLRPKTYKLYSTQLNILKIFLEERKYDKVRFTEFKLTLIMEFLDYLKDKRKVANKTYNDYLTNLSTLFNFFIERELLEKNPFFKIKKKKVISGRHKPFTESQRLEIVEKIKEKGDLQLLLFIQFIYYTFTRPNEIRFLQVKHLVNGQIYIPGELSKNLKNDYVKIPKQLEVLLQEFKIREYPSNYYIFSTSGTPGLKPVGINYFYKRHYNILKSVGLADQDYDLYGYKHTGVIHLYRAVKDIKVVQRQCRHSDIKQTDQYLKDLGLFENNSVIEEFPEF